VTTLHAAAKWLVWPFMLVAGFGVLVAVQAAPDLGPLSAAVLFWAILLASLPTAPILWDKFKGEVDVWK
tara:strand:+ start:6793 stop:6999 length:207 start_codon:yes stop_codon:yes gene_type:complete